MADRNPWLLVAWIAAILLLVAVVSYFAPATIPEMCSHYRDHPGERIEAARTLSPQIWDCG